MTAREHASRDVIDEETFELFREIAVETVTGLICKLMAEKDISRTQLAERLGKSRGWITQLLDGERNKTVATLSDVLVALGHSLQFRIGKLDPVEAARIDREITGSTADKFIEVMRQELDARYPAIEQVLSFDWSAIEPIQTLERTRLVSTEGSVRTRDLAPRCGNLV